MHPGAKPFPFLTPAYEEHEGDARRRFNQKFGPEVEKRAAQLARKGK
jgi:hypothetical protein